MSIKALHEWRFEPRDGGTLVKTQESFSGLLARLSRNLQKTLDKSLVEGLEHLKREAEQRGPEQESPTAPRRPRSRAR